jgi:hypothetical protein
MTTCRELVETNIEGEDHHFRIVFKRIYFASAKQRDDEKTAFSSG